MLSNGVLSNSLLLLFDILLVQSIFFIIILLILLLLLDDLLLLICSSLSMLVCFLFFKGAHNCLLLLLLYNLLSLVSFTPRHPTGRIGGLLICQNVRMLLSLFINHFSICILVELSWPFLISLWHFHSHYLRECTVSSSWSFKHSFRFQIFFVLFWLYKFVSVKFSKNIFGIWLPLSIIEFGIMEI
jgi:hypothetical protein